MRTTRLLMILACLVAGIALRAAAPTFWTLATAAGFIEGTSDGVYLSLSGTLRAGPALTSRLTSSPAQVWALARSDDGALWAGTGGDGRVLRLSPGENEVTAFDSEEANVFALAVDGDRVFAATSPDGKVYVLDPSGAEVREFFDPEEQYIWALAVDADGRLWVGAGNPAVLYRVAADGTSEEVYAPPAAHIVTLGFDGDDRLLIGTESPGRLYRLDADDRPFVVLDSGMTELAAISTGPGGTLFAAAIDRGDSAAADDETTSVTVTLEAPDEASRRSAVFRIEPDGLWEEVWSTSDVVYDLAAETDGSVLVASGPAGRLYRVTSSRDVLLLTGVDAHQITRFVRDTDMSVAAFATANPGRVVDIGTGVQSPARYLSPVEDTRGVATWGQIRWEASGPVALFTRSGNTEDPDDSWSDWSQAYTRQAGEPITSPSARYLQWRAEFTDTGTPAGELSAVTVAYLPRNNRPVVTSITVHPPGVVFQRAFVNDEAAIAGLDDETAEARRPPGDSGPTLPAPGRRMFQKGLQTLAWTAEDSDNDRLDYTLEYRGEQDDTWRTLREDVGGTIYVWDTTTVADGRYIVRVRASDAPVNAGDRALAAERESDPVTVDNTPPTLSMTVPDSGTGPVVVQATDARSPIQKVEYSVDGGPWQLAIPADGLADAPEERYEIVVPEGADLSRVVVRAIDLLQNVVTQVIGPQN